MITGKNCNDNVDVYSTNNNGKSVTIGFSHLQPEELYNVTIAAGNKKIQDLIPNTTLICMGELNLNLASVLDTFRFVFCNVEQTELLEKI